jgi:hypothetical protein
MVCDSQDTNTAKRLGRPHTAAMEFRAFEDNAYPHHHPISNSFSNLRRWYAQSALRILSMEIYALPHRIQAALKIRAAERSGRPGKVLAWMDACAVTGLGTRDYTAYIQQVWDQHQFLTLFDILLLTEAWKSGAASSALLNTSHNQVNSENS